MSAITLTGENDFARGQELRQLLADFTAEHGDLAVERIDGEDTEFVRIQEALTSLPFLANKKMVILNHPAASKEFCEAADTLLAELPESTELLLVEPKFDKRSSVYKLLKTHTDYREFSGLKDRALAAWLAAEAKSLGAELSISDAQYLIGRLGEDQQLLRHELEKLSLFDHKINRSTIDILTEPSPQSSIFDLLDAAVGGHTQRALELYNEQRQLQVEPQRILAMFAWQLHLLATVKWGGKRSPDAIAAEAHISPYVVRKSQNLTKRLDPQRIKALVAELLSIDLRSKRQNLDLDDALKFFVLQLAQ